MESNSSLWTLILLCKSATGYNYSVSLSSAAPFHKTHVEEKAWHEKCTDNVRVHARSTQT